MDLFYAYVEAHKERFVQELSDLARQPSIAAQGVGLRETAEMVRARLATLGASARLIETPGAPVVYGELGERGPILMIYDHYDVQPPEPLHLWTTPAFEPTVRDGKLYARGVADNKGNTLARIQAVEAWLATMGELPVRLRWVIEGEEEIGSVNLEHFVDEHADLLRGSDGCLWEAGSKDVAERPVLSCGLKGIMYVELRLRYMPRDLHSANATIVPNAAWRLVWALSTLKNERDEITIDGYLDHVAPPPPEAIEAARGIPFEEDLLKQNFGIDSFINDVSGWEAVYKNLFTPTCTLCGLDSGYTGEGSKTVLPAQALAKVDFRLVPNLQPNLVVDLLRAHLDRRGFHDIEIIELGGEPPARSPVDSRVALAARRAAETVYGVKPVVYPNMAGSGPMYHLCDRLGIPAVSAGCGYSGSNVHAPDENIRLADLYDHIRFFGQLMREFGQEVRA